MTNRLDKPILTDTLCEEVLVSLRKIIQNIDLHSRRLVKQIGLTAPQLIILKAVQKKGQTTVGDLSYTVSLGQPTVTGILDRLEKRGLVTRKKGDTDKRKVLVSLTDQCERLLKEAPSLLQDSFVQRFNNLQEWEQLMIVSAIKRIVALMDAKQVDAAPILESGSLTKPIEDVLRIRD